MTKKSDYYRELLQISYENDKTIAGIIRFSGLTEFFRHFVSDRVKEIRLKRSKTFFNELQQKEIALTLDTIKSEDFLHKFFISYKAALNTRQREKIKMFARLLNTSLINKKIETVNKFEDFNKILNELSYREIQALMLLHNLKTSTIDQVENDLKWCEKFWGKFNSELINKLNISSEMTSDFIYRLSRTGLYTTFNASGFYHWSDTHEKGALTSTFYKLKKYCLEDYQTT